ncbi:DUF5999 family protein [Streptomyces sp. BA2]|uniref:DUF5999 family protein n=1 Tax=Streptomyces sp. BA2 TaxID=436595 RepID=UPI00132C8C75|nr:DUF5999 family protein [Streptomyces sp. BA2]MWA07684.1 hypothetical protein [Streptomyces sp. BA2]
MCQHKPPCPTATQPDRDAARPVTRYDVVGCTRLCNGVLLFDDTGELLPDGSIVAPHRPLGLTGAASCPP